jgi:UDP-N-acetylmuramate--alanine ligase
MNKTVCTKENLLPLLRTRNIEILLALGAGDIDRLVPSIAALIEES